jgi:hypothetical protein
MKTSLRLVVMAVSSLPMAACAFPGTMVLRGSGTPLTQEFPVGAFTSVDASSAFDIKINRSDKFSVEVTTDDNLMEFVRISDDGGTLTLGLDHGGKALSISPKVGLKAVVTMPELEGVTLSGACTATAEDFETKKTFALHAGGASTFSGTISADKVDAKAEGASTITVRGKAKSAVVQGSGASHIKLGDLTVARATVHLSGASSSTVNAVDKLDYSVSGASHLDYRGQPTLGEQDSSGASSVSQK